MFSCLGKSFLDRVEAVTEVIQVMTRLGSALEDQLVVRHSTAGHGVRSGEWSDDNVTFSMHASSCLVKMRSWMEGA